MSDKFQNRYRIPSARLEGWNYSNNAAYFITICTENMEHHFGEVVNGEMELNKIGELAYNFGKKFRNTSRLWYWMNL